MSSNWPGKWGSVVPPVWEAVGRLEQEGLLENIPNRGVFMATLTPEIAFELYQVREELESLAATLAAPRIETAALDEMEKCLELQRQVIEKEDLVAYSRLDFEFHAAVYFASGNHVLQELLEAIKNKMRPLSLQVQPLLSRFYQDHQNILQALKKHDPAAAAAAFRRHNSKMKEAYAIGNETPKRRGLARARKTHCGKPACQIARPKEEHR